MVVIWAIFGQGGSLGRGVDLGVNSGGFDRGGSFWVFFDQGGC